MAVCRSTRAGADDTPIPEKIGGHPMIVQSLAYLLPGKAVEGVDHVQGHGQRLISYNAILYNVIRYNVILYNVILHNVLRYNVILYIALYYIT